MKISIFVFILALLTLGLVPEANSAALTRQVISDAVAGVEPTYAARGVSGDTCTNTDGKSLIHAKNPGASAATVTITAQSASTNVPGYGLVSRANIVLALAAGEQGFAGPFPLNAFNNSSGAIAISYGGAGEADVTIACLQLP